MGRSRRPKTTEKKKSLRLTTLSSSLRFGAHPDDARTEIVLSAPEMRSAVVILDPRPQALHIGGTHQLISASFAFASERKKLSQQLGRVRNARGDRLRDGARRYREGAGRAVAIEDFAKLHSALVLNEEL